MEKNQCYQSAFSILPFQYSSFVEFTMNIEQEIHQIDYYDPS